jgi:hypothetical protein
MKRFISLPKKSPRSGSSARSSTILLARFSSYLRSK